MSKSLFKRNLALAIVIGLVLSLAGPTLASTETIPSPQEYLGYELGDQVTRYGDLLGYMKLLGERSDRVKVFPIGKSHRGQEMVIVAFSTEGNIDQLSHYRKINEKLSDPRMVTSKEVEKLIQEGKVFYEIDVGMHAPELGPIEASIPSAYYLATTDDPEFLKALEDVIVLWSEQHPDGLNDVANWYEKYRGADWWEPGYRQPPYYGDYVSHDDNRAVGRLVPKHMKTWFQGWLKFKPEITWNFHQGANALGTYVYAVNTPQPASESPWIPMLQEHQLLGGVFADMTRQGYKNLTFYAGNYHWLYPGYADNLPTYYRSVGVCLEVGGTAHPETGWGATYAQEIMLSTVTEAAKHKEELLKSRYQMAKAQVQKGDTEAPHAWVIPSKGQKDPVLAAKLAKRLANLGIEVHKLDHTTVVNGVNYTKGSYVVRLDQPAGNLANILMKRTNHKPSRSPFYFLGWTWPLLMNVDAAKIDSPKILEADMTKTTEPSPSPGKIVGENFPASFVLENSTNNVATVINRLLEKDIEVFWSDASFSAAGESFPRGTVIIPNEGDEVAKAVKNLAKDLSLKFYGSADLIDVKARKINPPKLALYHPWKTTYNEGWTRMVLEDYGFTFQRVSNDDIKQGNLISKFDVICIPDNSVSTILKGKEKGTYPEKYTGGLGEKGVDNLKEFVDAGGKLILIDSATKLIAQEFDAGVKEVELNRGMGGEFYIPGNVVATEVNNDIPEGYSFPVETRLPVMFMDSPVFTIENPNATPIANYAVKGEVQLSGWVKGEEKLAKKVAAAKIPYGDGEIDLLGFRIINLYQADGSFPILFNAILDSNTEPVQ